MTISVNIHRNPLSPECREQRGVQPPMTLRQLTIDANGGASEWPFPTIAIVDGVPWKRGRWNEPLTDGMVVEFRSMVRGSGSSKKYGGIAAVATLGLSTGLIPIGMAMQGVGSMMQQAGIGGGNRMYEWGGKLQSFGSAGRLGGLPETPGTPSALEGESGSANYGAGRGNRRRLGEPIPIIYGTMRVYPDEIEDVYFYFDTSSTMQTYHGMCVGCGEYDTSATDPWSGTTPISAALTFYTDRSSAFADRPRYLTTESLGQELTTSYTAATATINVTDGEAYYRVWSNVIFTNGLFDASSGSLANKSVDVYLEVAEYNGVTLVNSNSRMITVTGSTRRAFGQFHYVDIGWTPTVGNTLKISMKRGATESTNVNIVEKATFNYTYIQRDKYSTSGTTLAAMGVVYGPNSNISQDGDLSIVVTRKLSAYDTGTGTWGAAAATRSIAWALADILKKRRLWHGPGRFAD